MQRKKLKSTKSGFKQTKKLVIKNQTKTPTLPEDFEQSSWSRLSNAIDAIHNSTAVKDSLEQLYSLVETLCTQGKSASLYDKLKDKLANHIGTVLYQSVLKEVEKSPLNAIDIAYQQHCEQTLVVRSIFLYLDRTFVLTGSFNDGANGSRRSLWDVAQSDFRELILLRDDAAILNKVCSALLNAVADDRKGADMDRALARRTMRMLSALSLYVSHFEPNLLSSSLQHFETTAMIEASELALAAYTLRVEQHLNEESRRVDTYIDERTRSALIAQCEKVYLQWKDRLDRLCTDSTRGLGQLTLTNAMNDLARCVRLVSRRGVNLLSELRTAWCSWAEKHAASLVDDQTRDKTLIVELLSFCDVLTQAEKTAFNNSALGADTRQALGRALNRRSNRVAQLAARQSDALLRTGAKRTLEEIEAGLDKLVALFRLLSAKDVFAAFYAKFLSKRLLLGRSSSDDAERGAIARLKAECGAQYTSKLEGMFRDQAAFEPTNRAFASDEKAQADIAAIGESVPDLRVAVLTHGFWPQQPQTDCLLPQSMGKLLETFRAYYNREHNGRRLAWQHNLSHCAVKAFFPKGKKELGASLFQTIVLLAFNDNSAKSGLNVGKLIQVTGLPMSELVPTLTSLSTGRSKILKHDSVDDDNDKDAMDEDDENSGVKSSNKVVKEDTVFRVNLAFKSKLMRVKINAVQVRDTATEVQKTQDGVMANRQYQIDAAIVRIMKSRKILTHNQLIAELVQQLKFPASIVDLKKRIETLLEREYIER
eukprot:CAMPEP_0168581556 /NCGR_PEP_ID=MMETSP0420-20121227/1481_1 /TAXON_ID=498008 /ORGANISM="Pessonella sp." /LENGTH=764 /DNA_ID=CAMNT_0008615923 /DNA_START=104 /DNA_END=2395 /DNA_ORIENTATION=+